MIATVYLVIVLLILVVLHVFSRYNETGRLISKIPGPAPIPFFGNLLMFNVSPDKIWLRILKILDDYYPMVRIWGFTTNYVFVRHPDDLKVLLNKENIHKSQTGYDSVKYIENDGLVITSGDKWHVRRKMLNPAFGPNLLKAYIEIVNEQTERFIKNFKNEDVELMPDVMETMNKVALEIICEAIMGVHPNFYDFEKAEKFRRSLCELSEITFYRASRPYLQDWMMKFLKVGHRLDYVAKTIREFTKKIIQDRREYHEKIGYEMFQSRITDEQDENSCIGSTNQRKRLAVLDLLLDAEMNNLIDERGVNEEVEIFIIAGSETAGVTIGFALMLLAENKAAQEIARDEANEILNQTEGVLTISDITKLDYLDRCIKETLRLYPSAPHIGRSIKNKITLRDYEIPRGTEAILHLFALHRDPNFWPDPEKFDPDRFLPENVKERHPFAYLPFGAGPRGCIGSKFAMLEIKAVMARILRNFYIETVDSTADVKFNLNIALKPKDRCRVKLIKIDR